MVEDVRPSFQKSWSDTLLVDYVDGVQSVVTPCQSGYFHLGSSTNKVHGIFLKFYILQDDKHILG